ncbi:hypothetical protein GY45DRAFT_1221581, partial [Cubamyces sp. BRFM 1775]
YDNRYRLWKTEKEVAATKSGKQALFKAVTASWMSLPYDEKTWSYHNPPLRYAEIGREAHLKTYIPRNLREHFRLLARLIQLYQHMAARIDWTGLKDEAEAQGREDVEDVIQQLYSGLRLHLYIAHEVMRSAVAAIRDHFRAHGIKD